MYFLLAKTRLLISNSFLAPAILKCLMPRMSDLEMVFKLSFCIAGESAATLKLKNMLRMKGSLV